MKYRITYVLKQALETTLDNIIYRTRWMPSFTQVFFMCWSILLYSILYSVSTKLKIDDMVLEQLIVSVKIRFPYSSTPMQFNSFPAHNVISFILGKRFRIRKISLDNISAIVTIYRIVLSMHLLTTIRQVDIVLALMMRLAQNSSTIRNYFSKCISLNLCNGIDNICP